MKRKFFRINETGGVFAENEEEMCKAFCLIYGYTYTTIFLNLGY